MGRFDQSSYMRDDFDRILKNYGHDIYLQRTNSTEDSTELSWSDDLEIHTVRFTITANRALPGQKQEFAEGILNTAERIYYFRYDANPFENDRIYELDPRAYHDQTVWIIDGSVPMFGVGGNLVYWMVGATRIRPN